MTIRAIARIAEHADATVKEAAGYVAAAFKKAGIDGAKVKPVDKERIEVTFKVNSEPASITLTLANGRVLVDTMDLQIEDLTPIGNYRVADNIRREAKLNSAGLSKALQAGVKYMKEMALAHEEVASVLNKIDRALNILAAAAERNAQGRV